MSSYTNLLEKRIFLQKKKVQFPQDWFETPTWPPCHWFGTPIWRTWRHVAKFYTTITQTTSHLLILCRVWTFPAHLPKHTMNQGLYNYKVGFKQLFKTYWNTTLQYTSLLRSVCSKTCESRQQQRLQQRCTNFGFSGSLCLYHKKR